MLCIEFKPCLKISANHSLFENKFIIVNHQSSSSSDFTKISNDIYLYCYKTFYHINIKTKNCILTYPFESERFGPYLEIEPKNI